MNEQKEVLAVKSDTGQALVIETRSGGERTYVLNSNRTMYLHVRQLQVCNEARLIRCGDNEAGVVTATSPYVRGRAELEAGSISVIGDADNRVRTLSIGFHALDDDVRYRREELAQEQGRVPRYTCAAVGFVHRSRATRGADDWFVQCVVLPDTLEAISLAVSCAAMGAMTVGLTLQGIYLDGDSILQSAQADWFLRPNRQSNMVDVPDMAHGDLTLLSFEQALAQSPLEASW